MKRRSFLAAGAATAGFSAMASPAVAEAGTRLLMVTSWQHSTPVLAPSAERLARSLEIMTGGELRIEISHAGERVGAFEVFDAVARGDADAYHSAEYYWLRKHPAFAFFTGVPFGFSPPELGGWLAFGGGQELWNELSGRYGMRPFAACGTGCQMGGWFPRGVSSLAEMRELRLRIPGLGNEVWNAAGVEAVNIPGGELVDALFSGRIDAVEWIGPHIDLEFGFGKVLPYYMYPGWQEPETMIAAVFRAEALDRLPERLRSIVDLACRHEHNRVHAEFMALNAAALEQMRLEYGVEPQRFPDDVLAELYRLSEAAIDTMASHDDLAARVVASFRSFRAQTMRYSNLSHLAYIEARAKALDTG